MQAKFIRTTEAETVQHKRYAFVQASTRSRVYQSQFSAAQVLTAQRVHQMLSYLYTDHSAYLTFRKTIATVKINVFSPHAAQASQLSQYQQHLAANGVQLVRTRTGLIYRIPRA